MQKRTVKKKPSRSPISRQKKAWISSKIRVLRHEGYPPKQAIAIAHRMAGVPRKRHPES